MGCSVSRTRIYSQGGLSRASSLRGNTGSSSNNMSKSSLQDEARSFRSKVSAIKLMLRSEESREAFVKFMRQRNLEDLPSMYFDIEDCLKSVPELMISRANSVVERVTSMCRDGKGSESSKLLQDCLGKLADVDLVTMDIEVLRGHLQKTSADIVSIMTPFFHEFKDSDEYIKWQKLQNDGEKEELQNRSLVTDKKFEQKMPSIAAKYPKILIADDSNVTIKIMSYALEKDGHHVVSVLDGAQALQLLKRENFDIFLLDLNMPIMNGFETCRNFHKYLTDYQSNESNNPKPQVPIILGMSILTDEETRLAALDAGMNDFLPKPFSLNKFIQVVNDLQCNSNSEHKAN